MKTLLLLTVPFLAFSQSAIDYSTQVKNGPIYSDASPASATLQSLCVGGTTLSVTRRWTALSSQTLPCNMAFNGGVIQPASGQKITITGTLSGPAVKLLDGSAGGSFLINAQNSGPLPVEWSGAVGDGSTDDLAVIQNFINWNSTCSGVACTATNPIRFGCKIYKISATLGFYNTVANYELFGQKYVGCSQGQTTIAYYGDNTHYGIISIGAFLRMQDIQVLDMNASGWTAAIDYTGISGIGYSSVGVMDHVWLNCNGYPGNGLDIGNGGSQADQLSLTGQSAIQNCYSGIGLNNTYNPNSVSINAFGLSMNNNFIHIKGGSSTNLNVFGGELDNGSIMLWPGLGGDYVFKGLRSENNARQIWTAAAAGIATQSVHMDGLLVPAVYDQRPVTTTTASASASNITLTVGTLVNGAVQYTCGDYIQIAGAGTAGGVLHTEIVGCASPTSVTISPAIVTSVTGSALSLDTISTAYPQDQFVFAQEGPYTIEHGLFGYYQSGSLFPYTVSYNPRAAIRLESNSWQGIGTLVNGPYGDGLTPGANVILHNNIIDSLPAQGGPYHMFEWSGNIPGITLIPTETGVNNAIVSGPNLTGAGQMFFLPPLSSGLTVQIALAHSLQAGANTFVYGSWGYYTSGGTISGTGTCIVTFASGVTGTFPAVSGVITAGAPLTPTASNLGSITNYTSGTLSNGSATCSGTATLYASMGARQSILSHFGSFGNITNAYTSGAPVTLTYSGGGGVWLDTSQ
jgi:hypothetical protein